MGHFSCPDLLLEIYRDLREEVMSALTGKALARLAIAATAVPALPAEGVAEAHVGPLCDQNSAEK